MDALVVVVSGVCLLSFLL